MKIKEILEILEETDSYKEFREKYPDSYFTAGFFILSRRQDSN